MSETIGVTGGNGVLATALREFLPDATYFGRDVCDVRRFETLSVLDRFDTILHTAALTNHQHPDAGEIMETNIFGTENVARYARAHAKRLVYLSTHYVYHGTTGDYTENDVPWPIGAYAWAKLAGEHWVRTMVPGALIVRGSWYTLAKVAAWARQGACWDAYHTREPVSSAARKIAALLRSDARGIINIGGPKESFAETAQREFGDTLVHTVSRRDLAESAFKSPYVFPRDCSVSTAKFDALGLAL